MKTKRFLVPSLPQTGDSKIRFASRKIRKPVSAKTRSPPHETPLTIPAAIDVVALLPRPLSAEGELVAAVAHLRAADSALAAVIDVSAPFSFATVPDPPFHSLARSILYQQLATKAAASIYARFISLLGGADSVLPEGVLALSPAQLRSIGVSGRKASYLHDLAIRFRDGSLSNDAIIAKDDETLLSMLTEVKGIGAWSVHMFLIFSLHRPDVLPVGDLIVRKGVQMLYGLNDIPQQAQMNELCKQWHPYRSVGAWYMWRLVESNTNNTNNNRNNHRTIKGRKGKNQAG